MFITDKKLAQRYIELSNTEPEMRTVEESREWFHLMANADRFAQAYLETLDEIERMKAVFFKLRLATGQAKCFPDEYESFVQRMVDEGLKGVIIGG